MDISAFLRSVAETYDRHDGLATETQTLLRHAHEHLADVVPGGIRVQGSGGKGIATLTPWVGFFDPDETSTPEEGLYLVYLFAADLRKVNLMLLQGITALDKKLGHSKARMQLVSIASEIRSKLGASALTGLNSSVELSSDGFRQKAYAASCIVATSYDMSSLPSEAQLRLGLGRFFGLYQDAIAAGQAIALASSPSATTAAIAYQQVSLSSPLVYFRPKSDADYIAHLTAGELVKTRRHETLVRQYGEWAEAAGFQPSTAEHPRDLVLRRGHEEWLVEAKVVYRGNATEAVRAAIGQLLTYRYLLYRSQKPPRIVALFSEEVGDAYVQLLEELGILTVWRKAGTWHGAESSVRDGLAQIRTAIEVS